MKRMRVCVLIIVLAMFVCGVVAQKTPTKPAQKSVDRVQTIRVRPVALTDQFKKQLSEKNIGASKIKQATQTLKKLPKDLQRVIVNTMDEQRAEQRLYMPRQTLPQRVLPKQVMPGPAVRRLFRISNAWPEYGTAPGSWVFVRGANFNDDCRIVFDGTLQATRYMDFDTDFFPRIGNSLSFEIPAGTALAHDYPVQAHNTETGRDSNIIDYRVIAPRGYRGYNGWRFPNFGAPQIPWAAYRDFFGPGAVEYEDGSHRPSAQAWYDAEYKGIGAGGNCYGMAVSSIRSMRNEITTLHSGWFDSNQEDFTWLYPRNTETIQTVQEDQGGQLSAEMAATMNDLWNNQDHREAWNRADTLTNRANEYAILGFYGNDWGHAVVCYDTEVDGDQRRLLTYDNNVPYQENETGGPHKSISWVGWDANTYTNPDYPSAYKMVCRSYAETLQGPSLPAAATGGAMDTVIATVDDGDVTQITDNEGNTFFNADGSINTDDATRIPNSMKFIPLTGTTPTDFPDTFIFNKAKGKDLTFRVQGKGSKSFRMFQSGDVFETTFAGQGNLRCAKLLSDERSLVIPNPAELRPQRVRMIKVLPAERVYQLDSFNEVGQSIEMHPTAETLDVQSGTNLRFNMEVETFANNAVQNQRFREVTVQANQKGMISPTNWNNLGASQLNLKLLNPNTNQQIRTINIRPIQ